MLWQYSKPPRRFFGWVASTPPTVPRIHSSYNLGIPDPVHALDEVEPAGLHDIGRARGVETVGTCDGPEPGRVTSYQLVPRASAAGAHGADEVTVGPVHGAEV